MNNCASEKQLEEFYALAVAQKMYTKVNRLKNHLAYEFGKNSLAGKRILNKEGEKGY